MPASQWMPVMFSSSQCKAVARKKCLGGGGGGGACLLCLCTLPLHLFCKVVRSRSALYYHGYSKFGSGPGGTLELYVNYSKFGQVLPPPPPPPLSPPPILHLTV